MLQTARKALCLSEGAGDEVHARVYEAQLDLLLDDEDGGGGLSADGMEILGELEGMLQVRGAQAALRKRTEPLYSADAAKALEEVLASGGAAGGITPVSLWGKLAVRQQALQARRRPPKRVGMREGACARAGVRVCACACLSLPCGCAARHARPSPRAAGRTPDV